MYPVSPIRMLGAQQMTTQQIVPGSRITQISGMTDYAKTGVYGGGPHTGVDLAAPFRTPIYWPVAMKSVYKGWDPRGYGNFVLGTAFNGDQVLFGHMMDFGAGNIAGYIGSTGNSTGPHTHFEVRRNGKWIDPLAWLNGVQSGQGNQNEVYAGASVQDWNREGIRSRVALITGNLHSDADLIKNHQGKTIPEIEAQFFPSEERRVMIRQAGQKAWTRAFNEPYPEDKVKAHMATRLYYHEIVQQIEDDVIETLKKRNTGFNDTNSTLDKIASFVLGLKRT